ncbi:hypothetical protein BV25DRAFT_1830846 [Artomyces pyxidatus]|uniref:Uncharacterized protein n=1 Tax=Artomyces pyxidatus TaxID=48021 RepID=A0ACB8SN13_9AGAM|nr:hypothetical protein BV25DRAFT_1830846 [Artomyces pyxidatus]
MCADGLLSQQQQHSSSTGIQRSGAVSSLRDFGRHSKLDDIIMFLPVATPSIDTDQGDHVSTVPASFCSSSIHSCESNGQAAGACHGRAPHLTTSSYDCRSVAKNNVEKQAIHGDMTVLACRSWRRCPTYVLAPAPRRVYPLVCARPLYVVSARASSRRHVKMSSPPARNLHKVVHSFWRICSVAFYASFLGPGVYDSTLV